MYTALYLEFSYTPLLQRLGCYEMDKYVKFNTVYV